MNGSHTHSCNGDEVGRSRKEIEQSIQCGVIARGARANVAEPVETNGEVVAGQEYESRSGTGFPTTCGDPRSHPCEYEPSS